MCVCVCSAQQAACSSYTDQSTHTRACYMLIHATHIFAEGGREEADQGFAIIIGHR